MGGVTAGLEAQLGEAIRAVADAPGMRQHNVAHGRLERVAALLVSRDHGHLAGEGRERLVDQLIEAADTRATVLCGTFDDDFDEFDEDTPEWVVQIVGAA